jgi:hypothetical protein
VVDDDDGVDDDVDPATSIKVTAAMMVSVQGGTIVRIWSQEGAPFFGFGNAIHGNAKRTKVFDRR